MKQNIFRKSSLDRIASPEQLDSYIRVSSPSVWLILTAIIVLLISVCVWGVLGRLETKITTKAVVKDGLAIMLLTQEQKDKMAQGQAPLALQIGQEQGTVGELSSTPYGYDQLASSLGEYEQSVYQLNQGEWRYSLVNAVALPNGVYDAAIVIENVAPFSFVWN